MSYSPFVPPLQKPTCPVAWRGGKRGPPSFTRLGDMVSRSGAHELIRAAGLPRPELLHMGATVELLANSSWPLAVADVAPLLGRIALDVMRSRTGDPSYYDGDLHDELCVQAFGEAVIEEWFT